MKFKIEQNIPIPEVGRARTIDKYMKTAKCMKVKSSVYFEIKRNNGEYTTGAVTKMERLKGAISRTGHKAIQRSFYNEDGLRIGYRVWKGEKNGKGN